MKSPMIEAGLKSGMYTQTEAERFTDLQVLKSPAGWYVGTMYLDNDGWEEPGTRDTGYFDTRSMADVALVEIILGKRLTRMTP